MSTLRAASVYVLLTFWAVGAVTALTLVQRERPPAVRAMELSYLPKGEYLRIAVLGYRQLAADVIWLKAVQHFGKQRPVRAEWIWAYHAADVVTDLDPHFVMAYQATGTVLGVYSDLIQESIAILKKGMANNPTVWTLPFYVGYDYFYELCDVRQAAPYIRLAATLPGAPAYLPRLAAKVTVEGGEPDTALSFLGAVREQVRDPRMQAVLNDKMREVVAEKDIRQLEAAAAAYRARYRTWPADLSELVRRGYLAAIPTEPLGGEYRLNPDGTVTATGLRQRLKVFRLEPCRRTAQS